MTDVVDTWVSVCPLDELTPDRGSAVLLAGRQIALFRLADIDAERPGALHAIGHRDPCSGANVLARGLVGSTDGTVYVASPIYKERFDLATGRCLDADASVPVLPVRVRDGWVEVRLGTGTRHPG